MVLNSGACENPGLINDVAKDYGTQCVGEHRHAEKWKKVIGKFGQTMQKRILVR